MSHERSKFVRAGILVGSLILILGVGVGLIGFMQSGVSVGLYPGAAAPYPPQLSSSASSIGVGPTFAGGSNSYTPPATRIINPGGNARPAAGAEASQFKAPVGSQIEFFANVTLIVSSPQIAIGKVEAVAIEHGGYIAFSTVTNTSAYAILRVPASDYQAALGDVQAIGNVTNLITRSNDVTLKMTDLNATLQSLLTEKASLLKILSQSSRVNDTLKIESQIQLIDSQVNSIESQILNARRLIDYSTITISLSKMTAKIALSAKVLVTPRSGSSPLAVTFRTSVKGGIFPFVINYNFGDGTSAEGEVLIHEYFQPGDYNATITATDSAGSVVEQSALIHVSGPSGGEAFSRFLGRAENLFLRVLEGIVEVAVVTIPIALVLVVVAAPIGRKYFKGNKARNASRAPA